MDERLYNNHIPTTDRWLTVSELATELKISQSTIRRRIKDRTIKALKLLGTIRIPMSQFYEPK